MFTLQVFSCVYIFSSVSELRIKCVTRTNVSLLRCGFNLLHIHFQYFVTSPVNFILELSSFIFAPNQHRYSSHLYFSILLYNTIANQMLTSNLDIHLYKQLSTVIITFLKPHFYITLHAMLANKSFCHSSIKAKEVYNQVIINI